ncbi:MAG: hypothetical protein V7651_03355 [Hyphomonas oceanitis]|uniref:hypothetical protein n=1 Tax=Hyphomonas oceanitis TaxID=81033 RepID=UPI0030035708
MMKRILVSFGMIAAMGLPQVAQADKFADGYSAARKEMNALGDKALAGDASALKALQDAAGNCADTYRCPAYSDVTWRGAAAATNLGWLYWSKEAFGADQKSRGMAYFAQAALLGSPQGLYQVGDCMRDDCLPANVQAVSFGEIFKAGSYKPFFGGRYEHLKAVSAVLGQAADRGLVAAAVEKTKVDNQLVGMARNVLRDRDRRTAAIYSHLNGIIDVSLAGLAAEPSAKQRDFLEIALSNARAQVGQVDAEVPAAQ